MRRQGAAFAAEPATALTIAPVGPAEACTRFHWSDNGYAVMVARTMDWPESTEPALTALPRGMARDGGRAGDAVAATENPARWTSRYGSVVTTVYGIGAADGVNEAGLAAHLLYLNATDVGARDPARPGVHAALWAQYLLDNAATVAEALEALEGVQIVTVEARGHRANVHLAIEDATGDSAIVEFIDGQPRVHHGRQHRIMTNDPSHDAQIALLVAQDFSKPASTMPLRAM
jgi:choloylglycine hydrolase